MIWATLTRFPVAHINFSGIAPGSNHLVSPHCKHITSTLHCTGSTIWSDRRLCGEEHCTNTIVFGASTLDQVHLGTWLCTGLTGAGLTTLSAQCTAMHCKVSANLCQSADCTLSQRWDGRENHVSFAPDNPAKCDQCDFTSYCTSSLKRHMSFAPDKPVNPIGEKCNTCDFTYYSTSSLKRHLSFGNLLNTVSWTVKHFKDQHIS